jgi:hypothetical protein
LFQGLFPREAFFHKLYATAEEVVNEIEAYSLAMAFPINGEVAKLRNSKGIVSIKVICLLPRPCYYCFTVTLLLLLHCNPGYDRHDLKISILLNA